MDRALRQLDAQCASTGKTDFAKRKTEGGGQIADLSTVWVVADVFEYEISRVPIRAFGGPL